MMSVTSAATATALSATYAEAERHLLGLEHHLDEIERLLNASSLDYSASER